MWTPLLFTSDGLYLTHLVSSKKFQTPPPNQGPKNRKQQDQDQDQEPSMADQNRNSLSGTHNQRLDLIMSYAFL